MSSLNHPHPGKLIRDGIMAPLGLSLQETATSLDVQPELLAAVLDGRAGITPELAERLERAGFSTARFWEALQAQYSHRMRHAQEATAHDAWVRAQVREALDDPSPGFPHEQVMQDAQAIIDQARDKS